MGFFEGLKNIAANMKEGYETSGDLFKMAGESFEDGRFVEAYAESTVGILNTIGNTASLGNTTPWGKDFKDKALPVLNEGKDFVKSSWNNAKAVLNSDFNNADLKVTDHPRRLGINPVTGAAMVLTGAGLPETNIAAGSKVSVKSTISDVASTTKDPFDNIYNFTDYSARAIRDLDKDALNMEGMVSDFMKETTDNLKEATVMHTMNSPDVQAAIDDYIKLKNTPGAPSSAVDDCRKRIHDQYSDTIGNNIYQEIKNSYMTMRDKVQDPDFESEFKDSMRSDLLNRFSSYAGLRPDDVINGAESDVVTRLNFYVQNDPESFKNTAELFNSNSFKLALKTLQQYDNSVGRVERAIDAEYTKALFEDIANALTEDMAGPTLDKFKNMTDSEIEQISSDTKNRFMENSSTIINNVIDNKEASVKRAAEFAPLVHDSAHSGMDSDDYDLGV